MENWYLLRCKRQQDSRVATLLKNQGFHIYSPRIRVNKSKALDDKYIVEPLFPGYLFIKLDAKKTNWNAIRSTRGMLDVVRFGQYTAIVDEKIIRGIKEQVKNNEIKAKDSADFSSGDAVHITDGCFKGMKAIFQYRLGHDRVMVLINTIGRLNEVLLKNTIVGKA